jgi:hypothetical protein
MALDLQMVGNAGLYFTCFHMSLRGWNAMPTTRNARGIDIIAYSHDGSRFVTVQVKALSKRDPVPLGTSLDKLMGEFRVIVTNIAIAREPRVLVLPIEEVRRLDIVQRRMAEYLTGWSQPRMTRRSSAMRGTELAVVML